MIKIEFIKTVEVAHPLGGALDKEDVVIRPEQAFNDFDGAWSYAMKHGCNPFKNIRVYEV